MENWFCLQWEPSIYLLFVLSTRASLAELRNSKTLGGIMISRYNNPPPWYRSFIFVFYSGTFVSFIFLFRTNYFRNNTFTGYNHHQFLFFSFSRKSNRAKAKHDRNLAHTMHVHKRNRSKKGKRLNS